MLLKAKSMNTLFKLFTLLLSLIVLPTPVYAESIEQQKILFDVRTDALLKGDIHYSFTLANSQELLDKAPDLQDFEASGIFKDQNSKILFTKVAYVVKKPVSFFDHKQVVDPEYLKAIMKDQKIVVSDENNFTVSKNGLMPMSFKLGLFYDSDDVSTLPGRRATQIVTNSKRFDVISQSAHSTIYREMTGFSKYNKNSVSMTHHIPLTDSKTLVITYGLTSINKFFAIEKILRSQFLNEIKSTKSGIDSYKID